MIRSVPGRTPRVHPGAWVDPSAQVVGRGLLTGRIKSVDDLPPDDRRRKSPRFLINDGIS